MKKFGLLGVACVALFLSSCSGPKDHLIGKWEMTKEEGGIKAKITMDFSKDKVKMAVSRSMACAVSSSPRIWISRSTSSTPHSE